MKKIIQYFLSAMIALIFSATAASAISLTPTTAQVLGSSDGLGVTLGNALVDTEGSNDNGPYGLSTPQGMDIDPLGHRLFVADQTNDRVLVFQLDANNSIASRKAIAVLGQADFDHTSSNREGAVNASSLNDPEGVDYYDDGIEQWLLVTDGINDRVLIYNITAGITNGMAAVKVLGQTSFSGSASSRSQSRLRSPRGVRVIDFGTRRLLLVADYSNDRAMIWDVSAGMGAIISGSNADYVIGQPNFTTNGSSTSATTNDGTVDFAKWGNVLFISESWDHRISGFDLGVNAVNLANGMAATYLLGQATFSGRSTDRGHSSTPDAGTLDNPGFLAVSGDKLFAVDSDNRRVLVYDLSQFATLGTAANGMNAVYVYGQTSLTATSSATTQSGMSGPWGLALAGNNLFLSDEFNDRITGFDISTLSADIASATFGPNATNALGQTTNFPGKTDGTETVVWNAAGSNDTGPVGMQDPRDSAIGVVGGVTYLFMVDELNHRVLAFAAEDNGTPLDLKADFVLGQPNFDVDGFGTSATTMDNPHGVAFDSVTTTLFVSDSDNDRIMVFDLSSGISNGMAASAALGQSNLTSGASGRSQSKLRQPRKLAIGSVLGVRYLFVADSSNDRIMIFNLSDGVTTGELAAHQLGGPNFTQNPGGAGQNQLSSPYGVDFDPVSQRLFVADGTADRVLIWELAGGITDGMNASYLLGHTSWTSVSSGLSASRLHRPYDLVFDAFRNVLWVADLVNYRVVGFDMSGVIANGMSATYVLGQPNFTSGSWQKGSNRTAYTLGYPGGIAMGSDGNLIITQMDDDRAVVFGGSIVPPVVNAGLDAVINEGATFTRSASFRDGDPVDAWSAIVDYGDGASGSLTLNPDKSFNLSHAYADNGLFTVTATVQDSGAASGADSLSVTVNNVAPSVNVGTDANADTGAAFTRNGTFSDPGTADTHTATVDYGDGSGVQALALGGSAFSLNHHFTVAGAYTVTVTVTDDDGGSGSDSLLVTVVNTNQVPVVNAGLDFTTTEGATFSTTGAFTDPDADSWSATVNYGDGSGSSALALNPDKSFNLSHVYVDNGSYTVTVTVSDGIGSGSDTLLATVNNVAPAVNAGANADTGVAFTQSGTFSDPGTADTHTATVDYGDSSGSQPLALSGSNFSLNHTYAAAGVYTVTVTVTDNASASGNDMLTVTVSDLDTTPPVLSITAGLAEQLLLASDGANKDKFGKAVAIDGNFAVIGAFLDNGWKGSAYVFERDPSTGLWSQVQKLTAVTSSNILNGNFGKRVAISGDMIVVGAASDSTTVSSAGAAFVFKRDAVTGVWSEVAKLLASDGQMRDNFGASVGISGNSILVGAVNADAPGFSSGKLYVFRDNGSGVWSETQQLLSHGGVAYHKYGTSIVMHGNRAMVSAMRGLGFLGLVGSSHVIELNPATDMWEEVAEFTHTTGVGVTSAVGEAVAFDGDVAVISAPALDPVGLDSGGAYVFERQPDGTWLDTGFLTAADGVRFDRFGSSLAVSGGVIAVGAQLHDEVGGQDFGAVYFFKKDGSGNWTLVEKLAASDGAVKYRFGNALALQNGQLLVGSVLHSATGKAKGAAYAYQLSDPVPASMTFEANAPMSTLILPTVFANDAVDGVRPVTDNAPATFALGNTPVDYSASDLSSNTANATMVVTVQDTTSPVLRLVGPGFINNLPAGGSYSDQGATATDAHDDDATLTAAIVTVNPVDMNVPGNYYITYNVTDSSGNAATQARRRVVVVNIAPVVNAGPDSTVNEGATFASSGSFTDASGTWSATVNYGDGSGVQPLALNADKTFNLSHVYADNGSYTVTVDVSDGALSDSDTRTVTVNNVAPTVSVGGNAAVDAGSVFSRAGSFSDPGADTWNGTVVWGDGSGTQALVLSPANTFNLSHTYSAVGSHTVNVTVTDDDGGSTTSSFIVTVNAVTGGGDTTGPVFRRVPGDITVNQRGTLTYVSRVPWFLMAYDAGDRRYILARTDHRDRRYPVGTTAVNFTATDSSGNATTVTVHVTVVPVPPHDTTPPVIQGVPADVSVPSTGTLTFVRGIPSRLTAMDNVDGRLNAWSNYRRGARFPIGTTVVTYTVLDSAGNRASASVNVTVTGGAPGDTQAPVIQRVPADVNVRARFRGRAIVRLPRILLATDNVDRRVFARSNHPSSIYSLGTTAVTYTATDSSGNTATATVQVTVTP